MHILDDLNDAQLQVVTTTEGPLLVLAGAGSGKTRSVIARTAYLIKEKHITPWNLLVVTFTNKAARELKDRLSASLNLNVRSLWIGTFHSICTRILRKESEALPYTSNFSIYDDGDQKAVINRIYKDRSIDTKKFPPNKIRNIISRSKNSLIRPEDFFQFNDSNFYSDVVEDIYQRYQSHLLKNNAMDFDDLLMNTAFLLHDNPSRLQHYQQQFRYVMIDEYQDTNYAQFRIINLIAREHQNLCVVGDDDQAIYSWRGADIKNILNFEQDYKNVKTIKLEQNYRSPKVILNLANSLIKNNSQRHSKELWSALKSDEKPLLVRTDNENGEAKFVAKEIKALQRKGADLNQCVVLYRTNAQSRVFENAFTRQNLRYQIIGGVNFYQRKEIKDILAYLRVLINPQDNESFLRIINEPGRGIGKVSQERLIKFAGDANLSLREALFAVDQVSVGTSAFAKMQNFGRQMQKWIELSNEASVFECVSQLVEDLGVIRKFEASDDPQDIARAENLKEFIAAVDEFSESFVEDHEEEPTLQDYLQTVSLQTDLDNYDTESSSIKLMTMHNAKGLEFDHVFIVGLEDGLLPHNRSMELDSALEEERRLLYVGITRTRKTLQLCFAASRRIYNNVTMTMPSRFIRELDEECYERINNSFYEFQAPGGKKTKPPVTMESEKHFHIGQRIRHVTFGDGMILNVDGKGNKAKLTISFDSGELKRIIGSYVSLI